MLVEGAYISGHDVAARSFKTTVAHLFMLGGHFDSNAAVFSVGSARSTAAEDSHIRAGNAQQTAIKEALDGRIEERAGGAIGVQIDDIEPLKKVRGE